MRKINFSFSLIIGKNILKEMKIIQNISVILKDLNLDMDLKYILMKILVPDC